VRMALGASTGQILGMIVREEVTLAAIGITLGVAAGYAAGEGLRALLAGVHPADATAFLSSIVLCFVMTLAGSLLPAWRAVSIDPTTAIRAE